MIQTILLFLLFATLCHCLKISDVSVLLNSKTKIGYNLHVHPNDDETMSKQTCIKWSTDREDLIWLKVPKPTESLQSVPKRICSNSIRVVPKQVFHQRESMIIYATDVYTKEHLTCEVFFDNITRIEILTTVRKLERGELEELIVQAFDEEGNAFTSLSGLEWTWSSQPIHTIKPGKIKILPLNDTEASLYLQDQYLGRRSSTSSDMILVKGQQIGQAEVTVTRENLSATVPFNIVDKFQLKPSEFLRVIPRSIFFYELYHVQNRTQSILIKMPSDKFSWFSSNSKAGLIDSKMGKFTAVSLGKTEIACKDIEFAMNQANGIVLVVKPSQIRYQFIPVEKKIYDNFESVLQELMLRGKNWDQSNHLVVNYEYDLHIQLFDEEGKEIYLTDNIFFETNVISGEHLTILSQNSNGQVLRVFTQSIGSVQMSSSIVKVGKKVPDYPATMEGTIFINKRVRFALDDDPIYLPIDSYSQQRTQLMSDGGSGQYFYLSLEDQIATISSSGLLRSQLAGVQKIYVFDELNPYNGDVRSVHVSKPFSMNFLTSLREVAIDATLCLPLVMKDRDGNRFTDFSDLNMTFTHRDIVKDINDISISPCKKQFGSRGIPLVPNKLGHSMMRVHYAMSIEAVTSFAVYEPLKILNDIPDGPFVVALGSTLGIETTGGPLPWESYATSSTKSRVQELLKTDVHHTNVEKYGRRNDIRSYGIRCVKYGISDFSVVMINEIETDDALPTEISLNRKFSCQIPDKVTLLPFLPRIVNDTEGGIPIVPMESDRFPITYPVSTDRTIILVMKVFDIHGNEFIAFESLEKTWWLSNPILGEFISEPTKAGKRLLSIHSHQGFLQTRTEVIGYKPSFVADINEIGSDFQLSSEIALRITQMVSISPVEYVLFLHPDVRFDFIVSGGSGKYSTQHSPSSVINAQTYNQNKISVRPLKFGTATISALDDQFPTNPEAKAKVFVSEIYGITLDGRHFIEVNNTMDINVIISDDEDRKFSPDQFVHMNVRVATKFPQDEDILTIKRKSGIPGTFECFAKTSGEIEVLAIAENSKGEIIRSQPFKIFVLTSIHIEPKELVLIPGSKYQLAVRGGHESNQRAEFDLESSFIDNDYKKYFHKEVLTIDERGFITALTYGDARIRCRVYLGQELIATKFMTVLVKQLTKLDVPKEIEMFDSSRIPFTFKGKYKSMDVSALELQSPYFSMNYVLVDPAHSPVSIDDTTNDGHVLWIESYEAKGMTYLRLEVSFVHPTFDNWSFSSETRILVENKMHMLDFCHDTLFISPQSRYQIKTNAKRVRYSVIADSHFMREGVSVDPYDGTVETTDHIGKSAVFLHDMVTGKSMVQHINVEIPTFLGLNIDKHYVELTLGAKFQFQISAFNSFGEQFSTIQGLDIQVRQNYYESILVNIVDEMLLIHAKNTGNTSVAIYSPKMDHHVTFRVEVRSTISPSHPVLLVNDRIKFKLSISQSDQKNGRWMVDNPSILLFNEPSRPYANALQSGTTVLRYKSDTIETSAQVTVKKISSVNIEQITLFSGKSTDKDAKLELNIAPNAVQSVYSVKFVLSDQDGDFIPHTSLMNTDEIQHEHVIKCVSHDPFVRIVHTETSEGIIACRIQPKVPQTDDSALSLGVHEAPISLQITSADGEYEITSEPVIIHVVEKEVAPIGLLSQATFVVYVILALGSFALVWFVVLPLYKKSQSTKSRDNSKTSLIYNGYDPNEEEGPIVRENGFSPSIDSAFG